MSALLGPITDLILFKLTWLTLVLGKLQTLWAGLLLLALGLSLNRGWLKQWTACLLITVAGIGLDQTLTMLGVFEFPGRWIPMWLMLLWISFGAVMSTGFRFLLKLPLHWQAAAGAFAGACAYGAAMKLDAVQFNYPLWQTLLLLAFLWALFIPGCCRLLRQPPATGTLAKMSCLLILLLPMRVLPAAASNNWILQGSASFKVLWWPVYDASLFSMSPAFSFPQTTPYLLSLEYQRDIPADLLIRETLKQWSAQAIEMQPDWEPALTAVIPDVNKGDILSLEVRSESLAMLMLNDSVTGQIDNPELISAFAGIWLAETTTHPELRHKLLGKLP